jgi:AmmeMemoRadiSam system protein A
VPDIDSTELSPALKALCGAFVSLHKNGRLRGCIGQFTARKPLYLIIQDMTLASATQDSRFQKVTTAELSEVMIEISVLSPMHKIASVDEIEMGKHGIYITKGNYSGTFLPQVAIETGWTKEEFLGHCAEDKAGLGWNGWKDADIYVYTAIVFGEEEVR